ncbi:NAD+ synthase [Legionella spiritensis]|uniref:NAD+ synthase n=1 Tax=Legionella spiritensis TaxID=452 RepID=UPI000F6CE623|nr:NAD+ synthase [Legionella spiritensis]VEG89635.1 NAD synthase (glutamine-hydrolysing) [Legionella spiritensis]
MNPGLSILVGQINSTVGAVSKNAANLTEIITTHQNHHDLIIFPELCLTGYPPEDLLFRQGFHQQVRDKLNAIAAEIHDCHVVIGHPWIDGGQCYNAASVFYQGKLVTRYYKQKLPNYGVFDEFRYFTPGPATPCIITIKGHRFGLCICEDIWQEGPVRQLLDARAETLLCINASPFDYEKYDHRTRLLKTYAEQGLSIIYVNLVGGQDELVFDGQSLAYDDKGTLCARLPAFEECLHTLTVRGSQIKDGILPPLDNTAMVYKGLVCSVRDYIEKNGFPGVLLGLSGGIDSALTLAIAVDALGPSRVHAVLMPSRYTADISIEDARKQADVMKVANTILPIEPAFNSLLSTLEPTFAGLPRDATEENLQARIRGMLLMALSNKTGNMVLTTSNKSETAVGYTTIYGDMAGGFAVLKDVLKTRIYELAHYRNTVSPVIPERVLARAPSAELALNQTDQDTLPEYAVLDAIIQAYMENNEDAESIIGRGFNASVVHRVIQLIKRNEYKRRQAPPGTKISPRAFGRDWRYPITNGY